jgi:hypothetical protein
MADQLKFLKGMFKDTGRKDQPDMTFRDALNAVLEDVKGSVSNEYGNRIIDSMVYANNPMLPVGYVALPNDDFFVATVSENNANFSAVFYVDITALTATPILVTAGISATGNLNFDLNYPVTGEFRLSPTGDVLVYFTDNKYTAVTDGPTSIEYISEYNPPRLLNVSRQLRHLANGGFNNSLYDQTNAHTIASLNIFMHAGSMPEFLGVKILRGGGVVTGAYSLAVAYADNELTETNVLTVANPVYITDSDEDSYPREMITGNPKETQTNKSILWKLDTTTLNTDYRFVVPYVIQTIGTARFAYRLEPIEVDFANPETTVIYNGLEKAARSSVEDVILDRVHYLTARALTQLDNQLYLANLTARKDIGFQRFANSIQLECVVEEVEDFDPRHYDVYNLNEGYAKLLYPSPFSQFGGGDWPAGGMPNEFRTSRDGVIDSYINTVIYPLQHNTPKGYRDPEDMLFGKKTFRRGEVYSFFISLVFHDGTETYGYHIPGRDVVGTWERTRFADSPTLPSQFNGVGNEPFNPGEIVTSDPEARVFQYLDGSQLTPLNTGYWENQSEAYPNTADFEIWQTVSTGEPAFTGQSLANLNIRHHKMPSNHNPDFSYILRDTDFSNPGLDNNTTDLGAVQFTETVRILGFKLKNIFIPKFILEQIQGYKVYYAKREQGNKTIIGQSGAHAATPFLAANLSGKLDDAVYGPYFNLWYFNANPRGNGLAHYDPLWTPGGRKYLAQPVVKFHDFNLLRKKHTVATATHIDVQYIVTMQNWRGGYKSTTGNTSLDFGEFYYKTFRAGHGDEEVAWIHPELGNTINPNYDEDQNGYDVWGPSVLWGQVLVGARYNTPGQTGTDVGAVGDLAGGPSLGTWMGVPPNNVITGGQDQLLSNHQTIFMLETDGATYLSGKSILKTESSTAFKGATYLYNPSGESAISLGLTSGLPVLGGYRNIEWTLDHFNNKIADTVPSVVPNYKVARAMLFALGHESLAKEPEDLGRPNIYLVNLCSSKTDVFEPFDQQTLVWTGHYQSLLGVNLTTGEDVKGTGNYYTGNNESAVIFGGDTYITRYAYRMTSQSFGINYFQRDVNANSGTLTNATDDYIFGDIPLSISTGRTGTTPVMNFGNSAQRLATVQNPANWSAGSVTPIATLFHFIVESDDNINFRHAGDTEKGVNIPSSMFFDKYVAADVLFKSPIYDHTKMDNILYEDHYSMVNDLRSTSPFPKKEKSTNFFPNRVVRSLTQDGTFTDAYRAFLPLSYKDFAQAKGPINNIFNLNSLLYVHTERGLFATKGKQTMQLEDGTQAYVGTGDIFAQTPDEIIPTQEGHLGLTNKMSALVTKDGYVFVNRKARKIFLIGEGVMDLSQMGLDTWCRENIPFQLEYYGYNVEEGEVFIDAPTASFGFHTTYDPLFKRIIITKRELVPTQVFINNFVTTGPPSFPGEYPTGTIWYNATINQFETGVPGQPQKQILVKPGTHFKRGGWTLSFSTYSKVWASRHSYIPPLYMFNTKLMYSFNPGNAEDIYVHDDLMNPGRFYGTVYNFEIDAIFLGETVRTAQGASKLSEYTKVFSAVSFHTEVNVKSYPNLQAVVQQFSPGFTSFYVYNTNQISGEIPLVYLNNLRKVGQDWVTNDFRDLGRHSFQTQLAAGQVNVHGDFYTGTTAPSSVEGMFLQEGIINPNFIDSTKPWYERKKFEDKFLGLRLISNNVSRNLVSLYSVQAASRISPR